ncbi:MAG TPA: hypothetical protein PK919_07080 [Candidatus Aminicenantes bacterium]|nr:hypothetical protein [Candidatus Aminicenantes bacterium]
MLAFLRFEGRRIFGERKNAFFFGFIALFAAYFCWSGLNEFRGFQRDKSFFISFEKEKAAQYATYAQYGGFGFRLLYEASPLSLFFVNSNVLQDVESNIDGFEIIKVERSLKGNRLFLNRGYFKDFAGILFVFGSLVMLYFGHLALVSPPYLRFMAGRVPLGALYVRTTAARLFWLDLFFVLLGLGCAAGVRLGGVAFSAAERAVFLRYLLFLVLLLDLIYLIGQLTTVLLRFRKVFFLWFFVVWFACVFLVPEISRISVFNRSQKLEPAEKVNLEKFRALMALEKKFRDYLKVNPRAPLDQIRRMQKQFAVQFINSSYLMNSALETKYLREIEAVIREHERQSLFFPTSYYHFLAGEASGKGYYGYLDFMDYIMTLRNRFIQFYLAKRYAEDDPPVESFVKAEENLFHARSLPPRTYWLGVLVVVLYGAAVLVLTYRPLRRQIMRP